jgi:hypothetical protein
LSLYTVATTSSTATLYLNSSNVSFLKTTIPNQSNTFTKDTRFVGINCNAPQTNLDVRGTVQIWSDFNQSNASNRLASTIGSYAYGVGLDTLILRTSGSSNSNSNSASLLFAGGSNGYPFGRISGIDTYTSGVSGDIVFETPGTNGMLYERMRITGGTGGEIVTNNVIKFTGPGSYGALQFANSGENTMFIYDSAGPGARTGWSVGQTISSIAGGSGFAIARTTTGTIYTDRGLYMLSTGNVGIGCNAPPYKLTVKPDATTTGGSMTYFVKDSTNISTATLGTISITIYAEGYIVANGIGAVSDTRIKENIQDVQDDVALQRLRLIQPKTYTYKDTITRGNNTVYGFIAQQIREVLPYATNLIKEVVPDIYQLGDRVEDIVTLRESTFSFNESSGNVKFIQKNGGEKTIPVEYISSNQLRIKNLSELNDTESEIFVYGREVNDFHTLNKDAIFTVNVAATQELDRQLQAAKVQIASLETRLALLESQFASQTQQ